MDPTSKQLNQSDCDRAFDECTKAVSLGVIARNSGAELIAGAGKIVQSTSSEMTEAHAVLEGVQLAKEQGCHRVNVKTDAEAVLEDLARTRKDTN